MAARIVVLGATGYTGRLVARSLVDRGARPVLAGRNPDRLEALAVELGGLPTALADVERPETLRGLLHEGDVLVTTVGPFMTRGDPALRIAIDARATYLDSTAEPPFVRRVFREEAPRAEDRCALLTAFGYDYVPGNLAGALALQDAGPAATRVDVGYFLTGRPGRDALSTGTLASGTSVLLEASHAWRSGRIVNERGARRIVGFRDRGHRREGVSIGGTEHFTLPRFAPQLQEVNVALGWFGPLSRALRAGTAANAMLTGVPGMRGLSRRVTAPLAERTGGGPDEQARKRLGSQILAIARDTWERELATVRLEGPNPYTFTGDILAWGAWQAATHGVKSTGALGPIDAFGLDALRAACTEIGFVRADDGSWRP